MTAHGADGVSGTEFPRSRVWEREAVLDDILAHAPIILLACDCDGIITEHEGHGLRVIDRQAGDSVGRAISEVYAEQTGFLACIRRSLQGELVEETVPLEGRWFDVRLAPIWSQVQDVRSMQGMRCVATAVVGVQNEESLHIERSFDGTVLGMALATIDGRLLRVNRALCEMLGYSEQELLVRTLVELTHPDDVAQHMMQAEHMSRGEIQSFQIEQRCLHREGEVISVLLSVSSIDTQGEHAPRAIVHVHDMTMRLRAREDVQKQQERQRDVISLQRDIASGDLDLDAVLHMIIERTRQLTGAEVAGIGMVDGDQLVYRAITVPSALDIRVDLDSSLTGLAVRRGELLLTGNADEDPRVDAEAVDFVGVKSIIAVPLRHRGASIGALAVSSPRLDAFGPEHAEVLQLVAGQLSTALSNAAQRDAEQALAMEREAALEQMQESERRFRAITETAADAIITVELPGGITFWNQGAQSIFGYDADEIHDQPLTVLMPERYRAAHTAGIDRYLATGRETIIGQNVQLHGLRRDGSEFPLELTLATWSTSRGIFVTGIVRDVTERRLAEESLRLSEERFRGAVEHAATGMALVSVDGKWLKVNRALSSMLGRTEEELLGLSFEEVTHPDDLDMELSHIRRMVSGEPGTFQWEKRYLHRDGHIVWALLSVSAMNDAHGKPLYFIAQVLDIGERKRTTLLLEASEHRFRTMVERAPIGVCVVTAQGVFEQVNEAFAELLGYVPDDLIGRHFSLVVPQDRLGQIAAIHRQRRGTTDEGVDELEFLAKTGDRIAMLGRSVSLEDADGVTKRMTFVVDISARKEAERLLQRLANHDPLTGLVNRRLLFDRLDHLVSSAKRRGEGMAVLFLDLDGFKAVNDRHGHQIGDEVLRIAAERLRNAVRESDTVARLAGDEFVILLPNVDHAAHAESVAHKVMAALDRGPMIPEKAVEVYASIGISLYPLDGLIGEELIACADQAMYRAKSQGKGQYRFYSDELGSDRPS